MILRCQHSLARLGYEPGPLDGMWGRRTAAALRQFRAHAGLPDTGRGLDGVALAAMDRVIAGMVGATPRPGPEVAQAAGQHFQLSHLPALHACLTEICATPLRAAHLIAQVAHESAGFKALEEYASGDAYEGRTDLGNTEPGDGRRFKGRGVIQLTGRANYRAAGAYLGLDLEGQPTLAAEPDTAWRVVAWYWLSRGINAAADDDDLRAVTKAINGGTNGLKDREIRLKAVKAMFKIH